MTTPNESKAGSESSYEYVEETKFDVKVDYEREVNQWALFLHLSQLAGYAVPFAGLVVPILMWQMKKDELPEIDAHGKMVANWMISAFIYSLAIGLFALVSVILFPLLLCVVPIGIALALASVAFPIIGALKANNGELWQYPMTIEFLK